MLASPAPAATKAGDTAPAPADPPQAPVDLDYQCGNVLWRAERFEELAAEFGLRLEGGLTWAATARRFTAFAQQQPRPWLVVRRLFGLGPLIPPPDASPDDLRLWTRAELAEKGYAVQAELDTLRAAWGMEQKPLITTTEAAATAPATTPAPAPQTQGIPEGELPLDDKILERFQFHERIFRIMVYDPTLNDGKGGSVQRSEEENRMERAWFTSRVQEWAKMLGDKIAGPIARDALMNDLYLRRLEMEIATADPRGRGVLLTQKEGYRKAYQEQVVVLQGMFPEMAVAGKVTFRGVVSDLIAAHRDYYAHKDRRLVDQVFTATEIEFGLRASAQVGMQHRFSLTLAIAEARNGLWDPNFKPLFKQSVYKKLDAGFNAAVNAAREAMGEPLIDLENGVMPGEGDQYEDFDDTECPACGKRTSSAAEKCRHCGVMRET